MKRCKFIQYLKMVKSTIWRWSPRYKSTTFKKHNTSISAKDNHLQMVKYIVQLSFFWFCEGRKNAAHTFLEKTPNANKRHPVLHYLSLLLQAIWLQRITTEHQTMVLKAINAVWESPVVFCTSLSWPLTKIKL